MAWIFSASAVSSFSSTSTCTVGCRIAMKTVLTISVLKGKGDNTPSSHVGISHNFPREIQK